MRPYIYRVVKIKRWAIIVLTICGLMASCVDLYSRRHTIAGPYFVEAAPEASYKTLYLYLGDGNAIGIVENVKRVGHTNHFIIAETHSGYYFIDRQKDNRFLNRNEIIGDSKTQDYFINWLDSLKIEDFKFDYYLKK